MALHPVRRRYRSALPPFTRDSIVDPNIGRHDRVKVVLHGQLRHSGPESIAEYVRQVADGLFFRPPDRRYGSVIFQSHPAAAEGAGWLLSAKVPLRGTDAATGRICHVEIEIDLNPTRFRAHRRESMDQIAAMSAVAALTPDDAVRREIASHTLDRKDNLIPDDERLRETCGGGWERLLEIYWEHVRGLLAYELDPDTMGMRELLPSIHLHVDWDSVTIRQTEVHWEYSHPSARVFVRQLETALEDVADRAFHTWFSIGRESEARQAQWELRRGVQTVVYAKAQGRVRFEIRYTGTPSRLTYPRPQAGLRLFPLLMHIRSDAQRRLSLMVATLQNRIASSGTTGMARFVEIMADILEPLPVTTNGCSRT